MRKLLVFAPFDIELTAFGVVIVISGWSFLESLLEIDFLRLTQPFPSGLSPPVVELKEHIVQMLIDVHPC